jgi:hypothetical protein
MSEACAYIEREYKDAKGRAELQRRVVEQPPYGRSKGG